MVLVSRMVASNWTPMTWTWASPSVWFTNFRRRPVSAVRYQNESNPELSGTPKYSNVVNPPDKQKVTIKNTFPQSFTLGVFHEFADRSWMTADLSLIEFSEFGFTEFRIGDNSIETAGAEF